MIGLTCLRTCQQVRRADVRWYTRVRDHTDIHVTGARLAYPTAQAAIAAIRARAEGATPACRGNASDTGVQVKLGDNEGARVAAPPSTGAGSSGIAGANHAKCTTSDIKHAMSAAGSTPGSWGAVAESCVITVRFLGYVRCRQGSGEVFDAVDLFLPDTQFETQASMFLQARMQVCMYACMHAFPCVCAQACTFAQLKRFFMSCMVQ